MKTRKEMDAKAEGLMNELILLDLLDQAQRYISQNIAADSIYWPFVDRIRQAIAKAEEKA